MNAHVYPHAVRRFQRRIWPVSAACAYGVLRRVATDAQEVRTARGRAVGGAYRGIPFTAIVRGRTVVTVWEGSPVREE